MKQAAHDIAHFRVLDMKKKDKCKIIVHCKSAGAVTCEIWLPKAKWIRAPSQGGERLQGVAPRDGKERNIAKTLDTRPKARARLMLTPMTTVGCDFSECLCWQKF